MGTRLRIQHYLHMIEFTSWVSPCRRGVLWGLGRVLGDLLGCHFFREVARFSNVRSLTRPAAPFGPSAIGLGENSKQII